MEQAVLLKPTSLNRLKYCSELYLSRLYYCRLCPYPCEIQYMWYCPAVVMVGCMFWKTAWPGLVSDLYTASK